MRFRLFAGLLCLVSFVYGQERIHVNLDTVMVVGQKVDNRGGVGVRKTQVDKGELKRNATRSLSELLLESTSLQIKSMGQGAQATVSFRGTSSNHTQVLWNGVSINSPQLGSFDFSQIPVYFVDEVTLVHGSSTPYASSGALGGTINFANQNTPVDGLKVNTITELASNHTFTQAATFRYGAGRVTATTRGYYQQSDNDYKYINKVYSNNHTIERRKEADYKQGGFMQEVGWQISDRNKLAWSGWYQADSRSLPQSIIVNVTASEQSKSQNYRTMLNYEHRGAVHRVNATWAYLHGKMDYKRDFGMSTTDHSVNIFNSVVGNAEYRYLGWKKLIPTALVSYRFDNVNSDNYEGNRASRNSYSSKLLLTYYALSRLQLDASGTLQGVDRKVFGTYSVSARYRLIPQYLEVKVSQSYNHRVPTLNDLYWNPGGNPDLKDETSMGWDATLSSHYNLSNKLLLEGEATYYDMCVDNWIMWIPKGNGYIWEPVNFSNVRSSGVELNARISLLLGRFRQTASAIYTYARSVDQSNRGDGVEGKQLPYVPRNRWSIGYRLEYRNQWWFHYNSSYTGVRFTSADESYQTNAYTLHNFELGYRTKRIKEKYQLALSAKLENAFNAYYESTQYYPMPLRMLWCRLTFDF